MQGFSRRGFILALATGIFPSTTLAQGARKGAVLLHGKKSSAGAALSNVSSLLSQAGFLVASPDLPWSSSRYLDSNWNGAMAEIGQAVASLRGSGATQIALVGHSMGCPAAMSFAAQRGGISALVLTSPGHTPANFVRFNPEIRESVDRAKAMVKAGRGQESATFMDNNQGALSQLQASAAHYLSYFDPAGAAEMRNTAGKIRIPVMWVAGTNDQVINWGAGIGRNLTGRARGSYLVIQGGNHGNTPSIASGQIAQWLASI